MLNQNQIQQDLRRLWPSLNSQEKDYIQFLMTTKRLLWVPLRGPQLKAYVSQADELLYGGSAGSSKTDLLIGLAINAHRRSLIFRREYTQLRSIIDRIATLLGDTAKYNGSDHVFRTNSGRVIELGAVQRDDDVRKWQGRAADLYAFDELANFSEHQFRFLKNWNRSAIRGQRIRTVGASNPPVDAEGRWIVDYWAPWVSDKHPNPAKDGELRWFISYKSKDQEVDGPDAVTIDGEHITPRSRTFIRGRIEDNPFLLSTGYKSQLQMLPDSLRRIMLDGDFTATIVDSPQQVIPTAWVIAAQRRWESMEKPNMPLSSIGVDVARGGSDQTVLALRYGNWYARLEPHPGSTTPTGQSVAQLVINALGSSNAFVNIDVIGVGSSAYDFLNESVKNVTAVNFAESSEARDKSGLLKLQNVRSEAYWRFREALDPDNGDNIALPPDRMLLADLCAPVWDYKSRGVLLESKEELKKRLHRSPDYGDAIVLAHYIKTKRSYKPL